MKMQIAFRETGTIRHGHVVAIAGGIVDVSPEEWRDYEDKSLAFRFDFVPALAHPVAVSVVGEPRPVRDDGGWVNETLASGSLEDLLTSNIERAIPNEHHNADFVLRETELASSFEDGRVFAFSGILHLKPGQKFDFRDLVWFEALETGPDWQMMFAGRSGMERGADIGPVDMVESMRGESMSALLRKPLWGFNDEPYGLPGTMRLDFYRKMDRYLSLFFMESRTSEEQAEFEDVRETIQRAGLHTVEKDEQFREFVRELRESLPEYNAKRPMTAAQIATLSEKSREILEGVLRREWA